MNTAPALKEAVEKAVAERDGRKVLACPVAFRIAEALGLGLADVGAYCNDNGIKIVQCQLGCFP